MSHNPHADYTSVGSAEKLGFIGESPIAEQGKPLQIVDECKEFTAEDFEKLRDLLSTQKDSNWLRYVEESKPKDQALHNLAQQYHDRCDAFDRMVCTAKSPRSGDVLPANGREQGLINKNARHVHEDIVRQGHFMGFTPRQVEEAIREYEARRDH